MKKEVKESILDSFEIMRNVALDDVIHAQSDAERNYHLGKQVAFKIAANIVDCEE